MSVMVCPSCSHGLDATKHLGMEEIPIAPGDGSVCLYCAAMLIYVSPIQGYRLATSLDVLDWPTEDIDRWFEARRRVQQLQSQRRLL